MTTAPTSFFLHAVGASECLHLDTTKTLFTKIKKKIPNGRVLLSNESSQLRLVALGLCFDFGTEQLLKSGEKATRDKLPRWMVAAQRLDQVGCQPQSTRGG